jgi:hypothetical protein
MSDGKDPSDISRFASKQQPAPFRLSDIYSPENNAPASLPTIIPFGKHVGRLVEEVLADDPQYLQWLTTRDWFRTGYPVLYQIVINRGGVPEDTPQHNALQVRFLNDDFCIAFMEYITPAFGHRAFERLYESNQARIKELNRAWERGYRYYKGEEFDYEKVEAEINDLSDRRMHFQVFKAFERDGVDVALTVTLCYKGDENNGMQAGNASIEIKPTVGDDYPAVLRQMRRIQSSVLFLRDYVGKGATREQFVETFKTANITVVFAEDLEDYTPEFLEEIEEHMKEPDEYD